MLRKCFLREANVSPRDFFLVFLLLFNTFTWFPMTLMMIDNLSQNLYISITLRAVYYLTATVSSVVGTVLSKRTGKLFILYFWMVFGALASFFPALLGSETVHLSVLAFLLGASFGFGMPTCLAYFADSTVTENRGRLGGAILLVTNLSAFPLAILLTNFDLVINFTMIAVWRSIGIVILFRLKPEKSVDTSRKSISFRAVFHDRSLVLYLVPWLMFSLIDRSEKLILRDVWDMYRLTLLTEPIISGIFAFIGGYLSDRIGRKRIVMYCFVAFGIAYAIIGIAPASLISWYVYLSISGIALGMLLVSFIFTLWGDLSQSSTREKYYVIGSLPFFLANIIPTFSVPLVSLIPPYAAFSFASFFLFMAVLPLMYAPETLPQKNIEIRRLKGYVEQAKKVRDKGLTKSGAED